MRDNYSDWIARLKRKEKRIRRINALDDRIISFREKNVSVVQITTAYIYVIENAAYKNWFKIGTTVDLSARLSQYQTSDPNRGFCIKDSWLVPQRIKFEKLFLEYANRSSLFNVNNEWIYTEDYKLLKRKIHSFISSKKYTKN